MAPRAAPARQSSPTRPPLALVTLLVFASGAAALVFQVAWMRELRLVLGATTAAAAAVLAIFMTGLGAGSALLGKQADRVARPLFLYGALEAAIALAAAATPWLVALAGSIYIALEGQESLGLGGATTVRLALAALVLAVPTFLMGGTLPAAVRAVTPAGDERRNVLALLYGSNTFGAVFGALAATFFALEHLGTRATLWSGCAVSLLAGTIAMARSRTIPVLPAERAERQNEPSALRQLATPSAARIDTAPSSDSRLIYLAAAILGFTFFALEIVWYRMLGPILGGTAYTFGLILGVALFGIGAGGILYNVIFRRLRPTWSALALTCGGEALFTIVPFALGDRLALSAAWRAHSAASFAELILGWTFLSCIVVLPVAIISGVQFPILTALLGTGRRSVSKHLGLAYAWNTAGAIAGSLVAGFGGLPLLTAPGMWRTLAVVLAILSIGIVLVRARSDRRSFVCAAALAILTVGLSFAQGPTAAWRHSGIGAGRAVVPPKSDPNGIRRWIHERRHAVVWEAEGIESSIGIDIGDGLAFVVNGKHDGNAVNDTATQIGIALLGAVLHENPQTALIIGLGTGESAGWLAEMRNVRRVDVVELEPAIDEVAMRCRGLNHNVLHHPRVRRIYNDGREFVLTTDNKYDLVISEPSNPYRAGIAALYTTEFYQAVSDRLNPGGLFIQWLQAYEVDVATINTVLATAGSTFDHVEIWQTMPADLQLVCSNSPIDYSADALRKRLDDTAVREALVKAWNVEDIEGFLGHFVANTRWVDAVARLPFVDHNTDDRTVLEYNFAKTLGRATSVSIESIRARLGDMGFHRPSSLDDDSIDWDRVELRRQEFNLLYEGQLTFDLLSSEPDRALIQAFYRFRRNDFAGAVELWPPAHRNPANNFQRLVLARCYAELARGECLDLIAAAEERYPSEAAALRAIYHARIGNAAAAAEALEAYFSRLADSPWVIPMIAASAMSHAEEVAKADKDSARRLYTHLSRPFAFHRFDYARQLARIRVAKELGPERVVEALSELEPHVPWTADILESRSRSYRSVNHPLAARAEHDWRRFQEQQSAR